MKILALDLGKFNTMCSLFDTKSRKLQFFVAVTSRDYLSAVFRGSKQKGEEKKGGRSFFSAACYGFHYCNATATSGLPRTCLVSCFESSGGETAAVRET